MSVVVLPRPHTDTSQMNEPSSCPNVMQIGAAGLAKNSMHPPNSKNAVSPRTKEGGKKYCLANSEDWKHGFDGEDPECKDELEELA